MYTFHRRDSGGVGTLPQTSTSWQINQSLTLSNYRPVYRNQIDNVFYLHVVEARKQRSASSFSSHWASKISIEIFFLLWYGRGGAGNLKIWSRRLFIFNGCVSFFCLCEASSDCTSSRCDATMTLMKLSVASYSGLDSYLAYRIIVCYPGSSTAIRSPAGSF